jgi:hypothetical protein
MFVPGLLIADSAAGILVAGMISLTGLEVFWESVKQLTDASDERIIPQIALAAKSVEGVHGVKNIRARSVGSGSLVDLTIFTETKLSTSAAHAIAERTRWQIIESVPQALDVLVRTQAVDTIHCPLLTKHQRSIADIEKLVQDAVVEVNQSNGIFAVKRVTTHYLNVNDVSVEVLLTLASGETIPLEIVREKALELKSKLSLQDGILQAEIQ